MEGERKRERERDYDDLLRTPSGPGTGGRKPLVRDVFSADGHDRDAGAIYDGLVRREQKSKVTGGRLGEVAELGPELWVGPALPKPASAVPTDLPPRHYTAGPSMYPR